MQYRFIVIALAAAVCFLSGCSGGSGTFAGSEPAKTTDPAPGGDSGTDTTGGETPDTGTPDTETPEADVPDSVSTASIEVGVSAYDSTYRVLNSAFSVLDADGNPIDHLDGGDFEVILGGSRDSEDFHDAQKLDYGTQVTGKITLMLDVSNSMVLGQGFEELKTAAKRLVTEMLAHGLDVDFYTFADTESGPVSAVGGGDSSPIIAAIDSLQPSDPIVTKFYSIVAARIEALVTAPAPYNRVAYSHDPATAPNTPTAQVEWMVIMTDGRDNAKDGSSTGTITTAKDKKYNVATIAVGADPDVAGLESISEFAFTVPEGGTYSDAVDEAVAQLKNYYDGFYVVDYMPVARAGTSVTYSIKLVGNDGAALNVTYDADSIIARPIIPPYCCKLRVNPSVDLAAVTLKPGETIEFKAVQLWTNVQPGFTWQFNNVDGGMTPTYSSDTSVATVAANDGVTASTATIDVSAGAWSHGGVTINVD